MYIGRHTHACTVCRLQILLISVINHNSGGSMICTCTCIFAVMPDNQRSPSSGEPHLFCDCDDCQADWEDISLDNFIGSDSDPDDDFYYDDT